MMRWYCLLLVYSSIFQVSFAQTATLKAWFDVQRNEAGQAVISGMAENKSTKAVAYSYSMRLSKAGPSGNAINTQSGSFTLLPNEQKILSTVTINLASTASFEVFLKIFDDEKVVAEERLVSDEKFISNFRKLQAPPQVPKENNVKAPPKIAKLRNTNTDALEIEGLIIDETRSKTGRDFYDQFYSKWTAPAGARDFTIVISELPARGRGARISVKVNGNLVVQRMLQPRLDIIELLAEQSVQVVKKQIVDSEKLKKDLETGDQQGSGIY